MMDKILAFIDKYPSFILTTHDPADADGLGAELIFAAVLKQRGKKCRIINASAVPERFLFMDREKIVEQWNDEVHRDLSGQSALLILDTSDENNIGIMKDVIPRALDVFAVDHHEPKPFTTLAGLIDPLAAATSELAVEFAEAAGAALDPITANAAYSGLVYDTGYFAYSKTGLRTFNAARRLLEQGAVPYHVYHELNENASPGALLLQKRVLSSLELFASGRAAVQVMCKEDLAASGARYEDAEGFINAPMKVRDIAVSVMIKETPEGKVRCSLRSKGTLNVSKIAHSFGGGGHVNASGFKSDKSVEETLKEVIAKVESLLE